MPTPEHNPDMSPEGKENDELMHGWAEAAKAEANDNAEEKGDEAMPEAA